MNVLMSFVAASLFGVGTYLLLQRKLSRIIIGIGLFGHGASMLFLIAGRRGTAPLVGENALTTFSDPLPQAMALTGIVITFGVTAFLLALAFRSWILTDDDEVEDDVADRLIGRGGSRDEEVEDADVAHYAEVESKREEEGGEDEATTGVTPVVPGSQIEREQSGRDS